MKTAVYLTSFNAYDENIINEGAKILKRGGLVVLPTETVYGIAVDAGNPEALKRLYSLKGRSENKPLSVHLADFEDINKYAAEILPYAWRVIYEFLPGPLTVILKSKDKSTVGLRLPNCQITRTIIRRSSKTVVMPSANKSGEPAPVDAQAVLKNFRDVVDMVVDCGPTKFGKESTVVDLTSAQPKLLRPGALDFTPIQEEAKKKRVLFVCTGNSCRSIMAHYLFQQAVADRKDIEVNSAGIGTLGGTKPSQETLDLLKNDGIDATANAAQRLDARMIREADLILAMAKDHEERILVLNPEAKNKVYLLREFAKIKDIDLDIPDPIGKSFDFYRDVYYKIKEAVLKIAQLL
jgi:tRNA threonylcarbamoyl adenosine modification protein (Sua5/YciO/YrdC/YwlC family)